MGLIRELVQVNAIRLEVTVTIPPHKEPALGLVGRDLDIPDELPLLSPLAHPECVVADITGMDTD